MSVHRLLAVGKVIQKMRKVTATIKSKKRVYRMAVQDLLKTGKFDDVDTLFHAAAYDPPKLNELIDQLSGTPLGAAYVFTTTGHYPYVKKALDRQGVAGINELYRIVNRFPKYGVYEFVKLLLKEYDFSFIYALLLAMPTRFIEILDALNTNGDQVDEVVKFVKRHGLSMDVVPGPELWGISGLKHLEAGTVTPFGLLRSIERNDWFDFLAAPGGEDLLTAVVSQLGAAMVYPQLVRIFKQHKMRLELELKMPSSNLERDSLKSIIATIDGYIQRFSDCEG